MKQRKRCDLLFLSKPYKDRPGEKYEQIFWLTQRSIEQHRPSAKLVGRPDHRDMTIRIASNEQYPWRFPGAQVERGSLSVGDYALVDGADTVAVVERKTLDNLLADFGTMPVLHQRLADRWLPSAFKPSSSVWHTISTVSNCPRALLFLPTRIRLTRVNKDFNKAG